MSEENNGPPMLPRDPRGPNIIDFQRRKEEILTKRVEAQFKLEIGQILTSIVERLNIIEHTDNTEEILRQVASIVNIISLRTAEFTDEGISTERFETIGHCLRFAEGFAKVAASFQMEGRAPEEYQNSIREAKKAIISAAIILYDELIAARSTG